MHSWTPSEETILVLSQAGFHTALLKEAILQYQALLKSYADLFDPTDKAFVSYLNCRFIKDGIAVRKNLQGKSIWSPSKLELDKLYSEGYWREIVSEALMNYLAKDYRPSIVISHYAFFRSFLRRQYPLKVEGEGGTKWFPPAFLVELVRRDFGFHEEHYKLFMTEFLYSVEIKRIPCCLIPRYFYRFVEHNQQRIQSLST